MDRIDQTENFARRLSWYQSFPPSTVTFHNIRTGEQVREPSLVALDASGIMQSKPLPYAAGDAGAPLPMERCRAVGAAALEHKGTPGMVVFSPLRQGQVADYDAAMHLFRELYRRVRSKLSLKPVLCVHMQEHTTDVEERALTEAGIQIGAGKVLLYREPFPSMLDRAKSDPKLRNGYILHIDPQDERGITPCPSPSSKLKT